jgi:BlaI family transcriptional regulator, penicillinase repressor
VSSPDAPLPGGKLEYAVLVALWESGALSAPEIHERVGVPLDLVYTTTTKVLERLHAKGLVERTPSGKTFRYAALVERPATERARAAKLLDAILGDAPRPALAALVDAMTAIDPELLDELSRVIEARRRSRREP